MMWFLLFLCIAHIEPVDLQGTNRLVLRHGSNPCEGRPEIFHENEWGYVGDTNWDRRTEEVVCSSTQCGKPQSTKDVMRPTDKKVWLDEIICKDNFNGSLWECEHPGFDATPFQQDQTKWITCSENITISLEGYKCAGAVKYSGTSQGYFCGDSWDKGAADVLCKSLGCGTSQEIPIQYWKVPANFEGSVKMVVNCSGIPDQDNLWQCAQQPNPQCSKPAVVICEDHKRLQIKGKRLNACRGKLQIEESGEWKDHGPENINADAMCDQMSCGGKNATVVNGKLKCSDHVSVTLMSKGKNSTCYGEVYITRNDENYPVCASTWKEEDAKVVCQELGCGEVISHRKGRVNNQKNGIMDNVECSGSESSLWHCKAKRNNMKCSASAYVVCAGSIDVMLKDGPGKCAGRVEIEYDGEWQRVTDTRWTGTDSADSVCQYLHCGEHRTASTEIFSQGSAQFLDKAVNCPSSDSKISDCIKDASALPGKAVMITCEEHKIVFLDKECNGQVGIEKGENIYWLSGHNKLWNEKAANAVCRQMHCGEHLSRSSISTDNSTEVWTDSYNCSSNATSLFECDKVAQIQNDTIATVICSGKVTMSLTEACWGNVNVCVGEKCGGVCSDTWTTDKSQMLCENLHCGSKVLEGLNPLNKNKVMVKSVHTAKEILNLNQSNIVMYGENEVSTCKPAYVVCSDSVKARISITTTKCSGKVELKYEGRWLPVCMAALNDNQTQNIICEPEKCGRSIKVLDLGPKKAGAPAIEQIKCHSQKLKECEITASEKDCTLGGLQCFGWGKMEVKFNASCSGYVYVYSQGEKSAISFEGWNRTEGQRLCSDLKCGNVISVQGENTTKPFWNRTFSCGLKNPENIWDCEKPLASLKQQQQLYIECEGEPIVSLSGNCSGEVKIDNISVCNDKAWKMEYAHLVCKELNCSSAFSIEIKQMTNGDMQKYQHVICEDYHRKLGQCNRFQEKCNQGLVTVHCVKSINFKPLGENCGGVIQIKNQNGWEKVCQEKFPTNLKNKLCQSQNCGVYDDPLTKKRSFSKEETLNLKLECNKDYNSIQHCVKSEKERKCKPAEIYCAKHEPPPTQGPGGPPIQVVPTVLGVGLTLIVVILIVVFVRVCIVRRAKRPMYATSRTFEREEVEFESGDYEDVTGKANEMEALSQGMFRANSDIIMENDGKSNTSLPYDDIDEVVEAQASPVATAAASGDKFFREGALDQSSDGVTYEVDDPQESYDDIEANPEISQVKAEVHNSPQTTPESVAVAPSGLVRGDEDYLVPGQDG